MPCREVEIANNGLWAQWVQRHSRNVSSRPSQHRQPEIQGGLCGNAEWPHALRCQQFGDRVAHGHQKLSDQNSAGFAVRRRKWLTLIGLLTLFAIITGGLAACGGGTTGGGNNDAGTTAGTYTITVTGSSALPRQRAPSPSPCSKRDTPNIHIRDEINNLGSDDGKSRVTIS